MTLKKIYIIFLVIVLMAVTAIRTSAAGEALTVASNEIYIAPISVRVQGSAAPFSAEVLKINQNINPDESGALVGSVLNSYTNEADSGISGDKSRYEPQDLSIATMATFSVPAKAAVLMAADTSDVIYESNMNTELSIASITKVMTLLLTFEAIDSGRFSLTDIVPVSAHAAGMGGSQIWLDPSEKFQLEELLMAIAVSSANDAAVAVAEFIGGSEAVFVEMMNRRAAELGMKNTHFANACGLDAEGHFSSAYDVALMSQAIMKHDELMKYTTVWTHTLRGGETLLVNTNKLLRSYNGITGLKTGTTGDAGICITATATREGLTLISVILGAASSEERFGAAKTLLDFGFANYEISDTPDITKYPKIIPVKGGERETVPLSYQLPGKFLLTKGDKAKLSTKVTLPEKLTAPIDIAQNIGTIDIYVGDKKIASHLINAAETVEKMTLERAFKKLVAGVFEL